MDNDTNSDAGEAPRPVGDDVSLPSSAAVRERAEAVWSAARRRWPQFEVDADTFAEFIAVRLDGLDPERVDRLHGADLYLCCGCLAGVKAAIAAFERSVLVHVGPALGKIEATDALVDEVKQLVRTRLLTAGDHGTARLADYRGRGDLRSWVSVVAFRLALDHLRKNRRTTPVGDEALAAIESPGAGPELEFAKQQYRSEFREAFVDALAELSPKHRNVLRHHYLHGLSIDAIGKMYRMHRSSAARRIAKARETLLGGTRRRLLQRLEVGRDEFESLMRLVESQFDISIVRGLGPSEPG